MAGCRETIREELFGQLYTLRQIEEVFGVKRSTLLERYHKQGDRGLRLIDRCRRGDYDTDEDFIRACARRGHSQKYTRDRLGMSCQKWYEILPYIGATWRKSNDTIEPTRLRLQKAEELRILKANRVRMHRCRDCRARHKLPKLTTEYPSDQVPSCRSCSGVLVLDKWADERSWRDKTCFCGAYKYPHHKDGGRCYASEQEAALAQQLAEAPPHELDAVFD